jgi:hypothetical protein
LDTRYKWDYQPVQMNVFPVVHHPLESWI